MIRIAFFDAKPYDRAAFEEAARNMPLEIRFYDARLNEDTVGLARGFDGVCVFVNDTLNARVMESLYAMGVKMIALRCAGFNHVDAKAAYGKIHIMRVPAYSPYAVAEHAMALLLTSIRRIHKAYNRTRDFNFSLNNLVGYELHGKTVGVIGTGRIGRVFMEICRGFQMNVIAYDKFTDDGSGIRYVQLPELFAQSDVISLHCPLTEDTHHLIDEKAITQMKKGVVILNTSRGALIDAEALLTGIKERKIGAACLDVYEEESDLFFTDNSDHILDDDTLARLISMPNVIVTSHQGFLTGEALKNIAETTVENILLYFEKDICQNEICYHCGKTDDCRNQRLTRCF